VQAAYLLPYLFIWECRGRVWRGAVQACAAGRIAGAVLSVAAPAQPHTQAFSTSNSTCYTDACTTACWQSHTNYIAPADHLLAATPTQQHHNTTERRAKSRWSARLHAAACSCTACLLLISCYVKCCQLLARIAAHSKISRLLALV
jgi:hypothetical protein